MKEDQKPVSKAITRLPPDFTATPPWAQQLSRLVREKYGSLHSQVSEPTRRLIDKGEIPINLLDYELIIGDLINFGYADVLAIVLIHMPPDVIELTVKTPSYQIQSEGRALALKVLIDIVLLNPKADSNAKIKILRFRGIQFTEEEAALLANGFAKSTSLQVLGLDYCSFEQKEGEIFKSLLQTNKSLKSLQLSSMSSVLALLSAAFQGNQTLNHLMITGVYSEGAISALVSALKHNKTLLSMDCIDCDATDERWASIMEALQEHPKLQRLAVGGRALRELATQAMAKMLKTVPTLSELHIKNTLNASPIFLKDVLSQLAVLEISGDRIGSEQTLAILKELEKSTQLTHLKWSHVQLNAEASSLLSRWLKNTVKLKCLRLPGLSGVGPQTILDAMAFNESLDELDLTSSCSMDQLSLLGLQANKHLTKLVLSCNHMDLAACLKIAPLIKSHPSITCIQLNDCSINYEGASKICEAMEGHATIRSLSLEANDFGEKGLQLFFREIKKNVGLVSLHVDPRTTSHLGTVFEVPIDVVSEGLKDHHTLIDLDHRRYLDHMPEIGRKIDLLLQRNFTEQHPVVINYLRGFMIQLSWKVLNYGDIGDVIWQYFVKDTDGSKPEGMFATVEALRTALVVRQVMLGSAEFNPSLKAAQETTGSQGKNALSEPDAKRQKK